MHKSYFKRVLAAFLTVCIVQIAILKAGPDSIKKHLQNPVAIGLVAPAMAGFTLADVLAVVSIIGVISALTIPILVQNKNDKKYRMAFRNKYLQMKNLINIIKAENGGTMKELLAGDVGGVNSTEELANKFKEHISYVKYCSYGDPTGDCWSSGVTCLGPNASVSYLDMSTSAFILNDGSFIRFNYSNSNCDTAVGGDTFEMCGKLEVDVNGFKGPNKWGKDVYGIFITETDIAPYGIDGTGSISNYFDRGCNTSGPDYTWNANYGLSCARKVLMNMDY